MSIAELDGLSSLEAELLAAQTSLNNLGGQAIRYQALDTQHFVEGMVSEQAEQLRVRNVAHVYTEGVDSVTYTTSAGTTDRTVFGDPAAGYAGPTSLLSVAWDPDGDYKGCLVLANAELVSLTRGEIDSDPYANPSAVLCIQVRQGSTWYTLLQGERNVSMYDREILPAGSGIAGPIDVPIATMLYGPFMPGSGLVTGIRLATTILNGTGSSVMTWRNWNFSALPLRIGD